MWKSRKQRAKHGAVRAEEADVDGNIFRATYLDSSSVWDQPGKQDGSIGEQQIRDTEYTGLDEYMARKAAEKKLQEEKEQEELSMTAMKYEPPSKDDPKDEDDARKRTGSEP